MKRLNRRPIGKQGGMLILVALSLTALIMMAGLVIDGGYIYLVRQKSQAASDAAALAAGQELLPTGGASLPKMSWLARSAANLNNMGGLPATVYVTLAGGQLTVTNKTTVQPLFLSAFGFPKISINDQAVAQAYTNTIGRNDVILVLDRSQSFSTDFYNARAGVQGIVGAFAGSANNDCQVGFVTFNGHGNVRTNLGQVGNGVALNNTIGSIIDCQTENTCGGSDLAAGFETALNMFLAPGYNKTTNAGQVIVFVSDGAASVSGKSTCEYEALGDSGDNGRAINDAKNAYLQHGVSVYSVFFTDPKQSYTPMDFNTMQGLVQGNGQYVTATTGSGLQTAVTGTMAGSYLKLVQ